MYYTNGNYSMGGNFKIKKQAPMDDRSTVAKKIDLQNPNLFDGFTYNGMIVSVVDDTINNGIYRLEDKSTKTWVKEGATSSTVSFATEEEVVTGTIVDKAISPLRLKNNNYNKSEVDAKIDGLILQNTGYNVFELPNFKLGEETKTAERWTDGKPIWRKVIQVTGMPVGTKDLEHDIVGFSDVWIDHSKSFMYWSGGYGSAPIVRSSGTATKIDSEVILINNKNTIRLSSVYDFSNAVITICICFTKANEDITTPVAQVPVILEGLSEIPSPKLGVETKTAMRHPISGKPLYTKTIDCGFLPATKTVKVVPLNITDDYDYVKVLTDASHIVIPNVKDFSFSVLMPWYTLESQIGAYIESNTIVIGVGMGQSNKKAYVTVEYTKTADTAATPAALIGGNGKDAYETYLETTADVPVKTKSEWLQSLVGEIKFETLTEDQKEQLLRSEVRYGMWSVPVPVIYNFVVTPQVTKLPIFNIKKIGNLVASTEDTFLLKKNRVYKIEVSFGLYGSNANYITFAIYNNNTNSIIGNIGLIQPATNTLNLLYESFISEYIRVDTDTPISIRMVDNNNTTANYTITALDRSTKIRIMEISTREMILSDFSINGKKFDSNNNIDLEGRGTMSNPVLNVETLTEFRHPISGKPIYTKTIDFGSLPNATAKNVAHGVVDAEDVWVDETRSSVYYSDGILRPINHPHTTAITGNWMAYTNRTDVSIVTGTNRTTYTAIITLLYTKTTDTSNSPVRLTGGFTLDDAIGALTINGKNFDAEGNVILEGLSELTSPKLNVETLTEFRHPVSGKPLYTKTIDFGSLPNNSTKKVNFNVPGIEDASIVYDESYVYNSSTPLIKIPMTYVTPSASYTGGWSCYVDVDNVAILTGMDRTTYRAIVTIKYTKTTDTAESPVMLVGGVGKGPYEIWLSLGNVGSEEDYLAAIKGQRGIPGPKGQDGTVAFSDLTPEQVEELTRNKYVRTRTSSNFLYYNKNENSAYLDITPGQNIRIESMKIKTEEDIEYDISATQVIDEPNDIGEYRYGSIDYKTDMFGDGSCIAYFPLRDSLKEVEGRAEFLKTASTLVEPVYNNDTIAGQATKTIDAKVNKIGLYCGTFNAIMPTKENSTYSFFIKNTANGNSGNKFFMSIGDYIIFLNAGRVAVMERISQNYRYTSIQPTDAWLFIVVEPATVLDNVKVYINNVLHSTTQINQNITATVDKTIRLFTHAGGVDASVDIKMFGLRIFNRVLTAAERTALYTQVNKGVLEFYHGSGNKLKEAKMVNTTINLPIPKAPNEAGALSLGLKKDDLYINSSNGLSIVTTGT